MHKKPTYRLNLILAVLMAVLVFVACKSKQQSVAILPDVEPKQIRQSERSRFSQAQQMTIDNAFLEGVKFMMIEDYGTAVNIFFDVLKMDNQHAPANFQISKIRLIQNQMREVEIYAERAHLLSPQNKYYLEHLAYIYFLNSKYQQALNSLERLTKLDPLNDDYRLQMANVYLALRKPMDAIRMYDLIEKRRGISDELSMQKIKIYEILGREKEIRNELQRLIQKFPNEPKYWVFLAELDMQTKKYNEAFDNYQKALSKDPGNPYTQLSLIDYYVKINDTTKMFEHMILAFQNPRLNNVDLKIALALPYYEQKENTFKLLDAMLSAHPEEPKALALYADFLQRDGRYSEAAGIYRNIITIDPSRYVVWEALLLSNLYVLDTIALLHDALEALERFPEQPLVYYMIGTVYNLNADYLMAMRYFEQAVQLAQSNTYFSSQIYGDLGDIYHHLGNHAKSDQNYRKALELNPENTLVLNNFAYFLSLRKEHLEEAEEMARLACLKEPNRPTFLDTYAWVLYQRGKYNEAKTIMEVAFQNGGDKEAVLLEHYGDILWKTGEKERALDFWKQAQALDSKNVSEFLNEKIKTETLIEN